MHDSDTSTQLNYSLYQSYSLILRYESWTLWSDWMCVCVQCVIGIRLVYFSPAILWLSIWKSMTGRTCALLCSSIPALRVWVNPPMLLFRAGHFRYFLIFSIIKNVFFCIFIKLITYFCTESYLKKPTPSQINLIKKCKNYFLLLKKLKNTESAQLCE